MLLYERLVLSKVKPGTLPRTAISGSLLLVSIWGWCAVGLSFGARALMGAGLKVPAGA